MKVLHLKQIIHSYFIYMATSKKVFFDTSSGSDSDTSSDSDSDTNTSSNVEENKLSCIPNRHFLTYALVNVNSYTFDSWNNFFPDGKIKLSKLIFNSTWFDLFKSPKMTKIIGILETKLSEELKNSKIMVPYPELVFNFMNMLDLDKIKVVIVGQDPYPGNENGIPYSMGLSCSVPIGVPTPGSLKNIYNNLIKFKHMKSIPTGGCLTAWVLQGCFMLNAALTTFLSESNVHKKVWYDFTAGILDYINVKCESCIFVAWGADAFRSLERIDKNKHTIISSSHPSGYSYKSTFKTTKNSEVTVHSSFESTDHFGKINSYLKQNNKSPIIWNTIL